MTHSTLWNGMFRAIKLPLSPKRCEIGPMLLLIIDRITDKQYGRLS